MIPGAALVLMSRLTDTVVETTIPASFAVAVTGLLLSLGTAVRQSRIDRHGDRDTPAVPPALVE